MHKDLDPELGAVWIGTWCGLDWLTAQPNLRPGARDPAGEATWPVPADVTGPGLKGAARPGTPGSECTAYDAAQAFRERSYRAAANSPARAM